MREKCKEVHLKRFLGPSREDRNELREDLPVRIPPLSLPRGRLNGIGSAFADQRSNVSRNLYNLHPSPSKNLARNPVPITAGASSLQVCLAGTNDVGYLEDVL